MLRGKLDTIVAALAAREDIPFIDVTTAGDEIFAVARTEPGSRDPLVFRQLPSTQAVTSWTAPPSSTSSGSPLSGGTPS